MDGSDGRTDLRMSIPATSGCFVRTTAKRDGSLLLIGELCRPSPRPVIRARWCCSGNGRAHELICNMSKALQVLLSALSLLVSSVLIPIVLLGWAYGIIPPV